MVSWKGALALGAVLVALAAYAFLTRGGHSTPAPVQLLPCPVFETVELRLTGSDGKVLDAQRATPSEPWRLSAPTPGPADGTAVDNLVIAASGIQPATTVKSPPPASEQGLDPPQLTVACTLRGGRSYTLSVGGQNFDGSGDYARAGTGARLYVIPSASVAKFRSALNNPPVAVSPSPSGSPSPSPST